MLYNEHMPKQVRIYRGRRRRDLDYLNVYDVYLLNGKKSEVTKFHYQYTLIGDKKYTFNGRRHIPYEET